MHRRIVFFGKRPGVRIAGTEGKGHM
jgi:hypothetical protein